LQRHDQKEEEEDKVSGLPGAVNGPRVASAFPFFGSR
jgi:hypothetical protein